MSLQEMSPVLMILGGGIVLRIHIWRIRKNQEKLILSLKTKQEENGTGSNLHSVIENLHKLMEIQEHSRMDYFALLVLAMMILFKTYL